MYIWVVELCRNGSPKAGEWERLIHGSPLYIIYACTVYMYGCMHPNSDALVLGSRLCVLPCLVFIELLFIIPVPVPVPLSCLCNSGDVSCTGINYYEQDVGMAGPSNDFINI